MNEHYQPETFVPGTPLPIRPSRSERMVADLVQLPVIDAAPFDLSDLDQIPAVVLTLPRNSQAGLASIRRSVA